MGKPKPKPLAPQGSFRPDVTLEDVRKLIADFAAEREWEQFHTPRNLALALTGEVGELCEIFQWKGEVEPGLPGFSEEEKVHVGEEMSDVLLYLTRMADRCGIDLPSAVIRKMEKNRMKYPADKARGNSAKYTAYTSTAAASAPAPAPAPAPTPPVPSPVPAAPVTAARTQKPAWVTAESNYAFTVAAVVLAAALLFLFAVRALFPAVWRSFATSRL